MNRGRILFFLVSLAVLVPLATGTLARAVSQDEEGEDSLYKYLSVFSEVLNLVRRAYVDETTIDGLFDGALDGSTDALDALSTYVPGEALDGYLRAQEIGVRRSGLTVVRERGISYILAVSPGGPGAVAGLRKGDILSKLDGASTRRMPLWKLRAALAGEPGTEIGIQVVRRGQTHDLRLELAEYAPPPPALREVDDAPVLTIAEFGPGTAAEVRRLLASLGPERSGLVVDLRGTAGGDAEAAYAVAGLFASGRLGELKSRRGTVQSFEGGQEPVWRGRLVVLTDRGSQGASEILAAALAQAAGGELVGERTFGHAGRMAQVELADGGRLFLTDAFYCGPDGEVIDASVVPGVLVSESTRRFSETEVPIEDLILERGLEILREAEEPLRKVA